MRRLLAVCLLVMVLPSCTLLKQTGHYLCEGQTTVSGVITDAGGFLGPIGVGAATVTNALLDFLCGLTNEALAAPDRLLSPAEEAATDEPPVATDPDTDPADGL